MQRTAQRRPLLPYRCGAGWKDTDSTSARGAERAWTRVGSLLASGSIGNRTLRSRGPRELRENEILGCCAQVGHVSLIAGFCVGADDWFRAREAVANPGAVFEDQLEAVGADDLDDFASTELGRIYLQLLSEAGFSLGGQVKVLSNRIEGTYFV